MKSSATMPTTTPVGFGRIIVTVVVDAQPVAGAQVTIHETRTGRRVRKLATNLQGQATFGVPAPDHYTCATTLPAGYGRPGAAGVTSHSASFLVGDGAIAHRALPYRWLRGSVVDGHGTPLVGSQVGELTVRLQGQDAVQEPSPDQGPAEQEVGATPDPRTGSFAFAVAPGAYEVECIQHGQVVGRRQVTIRDANADGSLAITPLST